MALGIAGSSLLLFKMLHNAHQNDYVPGNSSNPSYQIPKEKAQLQLRRIFCCLVTADQPNNCIYSEPVEWFIPIDTDDCYPHQIKEALTSAVGGAHHAFNKVKSIETYDWPLHPLMMKIVLATTDRRPALAYWHSVFRVVRALQAMYGSESMQAFEQNGNGTLSLIYHRKNLDDADTDAYGETFGSSLRDILKTKLIKDAMRYYLMQPTKLSLQELDQLIPYKSEGDTRSIATLMVNELKPFVAQTFIQAADDILSGQAPEQAAQTLFSNNKFLHAMRTDKDLKNAVLRMISRPHIAPDLRGLMNNAIANATIDS